MIIPRLIYIDLERYILIFISIEITIKKILPFMLQEISSYCKELDLFKKSKRSNWRPRKFQILQHFKFHEYVFHKGATMKITTVIKFFF